MQVFTLIDNNILLGQNSQIKEETSAEYSPKQAATRQVDIKMLNSF